MSDEGMSSNRSDSDNTDCELNPLEDVEDGSNHKITDEDEPNHPTAVKKPRVTVSSDTNIWDIFKKIPKEPGIALCRLCHRKLSFRSTSANLKKHLDHKHALEIEAGLLPSSTDDELKPPAAAAAAVKQPRVSGDRNTKLWDIFEKIPEEPGIALCRLCHRKLSFRSNSTNLKKHLDHKHALEIEPGLLPSSTDDELKPLAAAAVKQPRVSGDRNTNLWDIFEKIPEEPGIALCRLCHRKLSFRTTSANLKKHLDHIHALEIEAGLQPSGPTDTPLYRPKSIAWNYFSVMCRTRRRARCKLCSKIYSYATSVTNLLTHLERRHNSVHLEENGQLQANPTSAVWAYFKCLDETLQLASCLVCKKRVDYSDDCKELKRHLVRKHPNVDLDDSSAGKTFMVTDSGDLFEIDVNKSDAVAAESDNDENEAYEVDYLDDTTYVEPEEQIEVKTRRNAPNIRMRPHVIPKQQSEKLVLSKPKQDITKEVPEDTIDVFGRYIVTLLKMMPKNTSDKLQYQILKQIFDVKSEEATSVKDNNVTSNSENHML